MTIGQLRHQVTIQRQVRTEDGAGGGEISWSDVGTVWAEIKPARASEKFFAQKLEQNVTHTVKLRDRFELESDQRLKFGDRVFHIRGVLNPDERNRWTILNCEEGTAS